jgi:hypothetical protein
MLPPVLASEPLIRAADAGDEAAGAASDGGGAVDDTDSDADDAAGTAPEPDEGPADAPAADESASDAGGAESAATDDGRSPGASEPDDDLSTADPLLGSDPDGDEDDDAGRTSRETDDGSTTDEAAEDGRKYTSSTSAGETRHRPDTGPSTDRSDDGDDSDDGADEDDAARRESAESAESGGDGPSPGESLTRRDYTKVMRFLQNRELPVEKAEFVDLASNTYQLSTAECEYILELGWAKFLGLEIEAQHEVQGMLPNDLDTSRFVLPLPLPFSGIARTIQKHRYVGDGLPLSGSKARSPDHETPESLQDHGPGPVPPASRLSCHPSATGPDHRELDAVQSPEPLDARELPMLEGTACSQHAETDRVSSYIAHRLLRRRLHRDSTPRPASLPSSG